MGFRPRPGATSHRPSSPWSAKRFRHRITVFRFIESCCAIATSDSPAAAANTIRQRSATCCGVPWAPAHCCIFCRSTAESSHELPMQQHNPKLHQLSSYLLDTTLGFKAQVERAEENLEQRAKLRDILSLMRDTLCESPAVGMRFTYFSDCIVLSAQ